MKKTITSLINNTNGVIQAIPVRIDEIDDSLENEIKFLKSENEQLKVSIEYEKELRKLCEEKVIVLEQKIKELAMQKNRKRRTKKELEEEKKGWSELKSNGLPKAKPAESIRSYDDFVAIQNYFLKQNSIRDWMLWTIGVSLGLRISDLLKLKIKDILNPDLTFKKRIKIVEQKTSKLNDCLITEAVVKSVSKYLESINNEFQLDDYLFVSKKTKGKMREEVGWRIISNAGKVLDIPINIGSHTMRKSFANIAACVNKSSIDMNTITTIQGLLNHSDQRVTMKYLGTFQEMYDNARIAVSDFVLGKTNIKELHANNSFNLKELFEKLDSLERKLFYE